MAAPTRSARVGLKSSLRMRHARVLAFFAGVVLSVFWWDILLRRLGLRALARRTAPSRYQNAAARFRKLATGLGGLWIKVGQFLSARVDVLPEAVTRELSGLQDEVAPEPFDAMRRVVEAELGGALAERFASLDPEPLASASLGQVHRARLPSGEAVVVKVQRPRIHDLLRVDLAALQTVIGWLKRYRPIRRRANLDALFSEFSRTLWEEVDYLAEAGNARRFGEIFASDPGVRIPAVYASHTTSRVLTLEDVYFAKITDYAAIDAAGVDRVEVANRLFRTYLRQIFVEGFFHADPHPGNLFVEPLPAAGEWRLVFVDFGMVGTLSAEAKRGLSDLAIAIGARDVERLIRAYQGLGVLLPGADLARIRQAEAALLEQVWGKSVRELVRLHPQQMRAFMNEFRDLLYEMPFQLPEDLIFLGRCVAILSGMCTGLNPDFNLFEGLAPFARELLAQEGGTWLDTLLQWITEQGGALATLPGRLTSTLGRLERGELVVTSRAAPDLEQRLSALTRAGNRLVGAVVFAALLLAGTLLYLAGERALGAAAFALALLALAWVVLGLR